MNEQEAIANLIIQSDNPKYTEAQRGVLVTECWKMLEPAVKEAYTTQLNNQTTGKILINDQEKEGVTQFANSMKRLQDSFKPEQMAEAVENFRSVDKSKYSTEQPLFKDNFVTELKKHPILEKAAAGISTQLATLTSDKEMDSAALNKVTANILVGLVSNKSITHQRSPDSKKIDTYGQIHPSLVIAAANYAKENIEALHNLDDKDLKAIGGTLKNACKTFDLSPSNKRVPLLDATQKAFTKVSLSPEMQAKSQARAAVSKLDTKFMNDSSSTHSIASISTRSRSSSEESGQSR